MRKQLIVMVFALLPACSLLAPQKFDAVLQLGFSSLWQEAKRLEQACARTERDRELEAQIVRRMYDTSMLLGAYVHYQDDHGAKDMILAYHHLQDRAQPALGEGAVFCRESAINLQDAALQALKTISRRPK